MGLTKADGDKVVEDLRRDTDAQGITTLTAAQIGTFDGGFLVGIPLSGASWVIDDPDAPTKLTLSGTFRDPWHLPTGGAAISGLKAVVVATEASAALTLSGGSITLGSGTTVKPTVAVDDAGTVTLEVEKIGLTDLVRDIAGVAAFSLPAGFPDIEITKPTLVLPKAGAEIPFSFTSRVAAAGWGHLDVGVVVYTQKDAAGRSYRQWAVALTTDAWSASWKPASRWEGVATFAIEGASLLVASKAPKDVPWRALLPAADLSEQSPLAVLADNAVDLRDGYSFGAQLSLEKATTLDRLKTALGLVGFGLVVTESKSGAVSVFVRNSVATIGTSRPVALTVTLLYTTDAAGATSVAVSADGTAKLDDGEPLAVAVKGALDSDGKWSLIFNLKEWRNPFGVENLSVHEVKLTLAISTTGSTITLAGSFGVILKSGRHLDFTVAGMLRNFGQPGGLAFTMKTTDKTELRLGDIVRAVLRSEEVDRLETRVKELDATIGANTAAAPTDAQAKDALDRATADRATAAASFATAKAKVVGQMTAIDTAVAAIDSAIALETLSMWAVSGTEALEVAKETYAPGFGLRAAFSIMRKPGVLFIDVNQKERRFSGRAELPEAITFGGVVTLGRPADPKIPAPGTVAARTLDPGKGPVVAVSSVIDTTYTEYLLLAASVAVLDIAHMDVFVKVDPTGFVFHLDAGVRAKAIDPAGKDTAAWASQVVTVRVDTVALTCAARFTTTFGMQHVTLGGFTILGVKAPTVTIPDFSVDADLTVAVDATAGRVGLTGSLQFTFQGYTYTATLPTGGKDMLTLSLKSAPTTVAGFGDAVLTWIKGQLVSLMTARFADAKAFASWAGTYASATASQVAGVLKNQFNESAADATAIMKSAYSAGSATALVALETAGYAASEVTSAMKTVYGWSDAVADAASSVYGSATKHVKEFAGVKDISLVLFNLTDHDLVTVDTFGKDIDAVPSAVTVPAGGTAVVGNFRASTGRWGYVYLKDVTNGTPVQLYIQMANVWGTRYQSLQYRHEKPEKHNPHSLPIPGGEKAASAKWETDVSAAYTLRSLPPWKP